MQNGPPGNPRFHYGWVIVTAGMLCILACLGFGRFALGMLIPSMAATLGLSYSQMGFLSTANFLVQGWTGRFRPHQPRQI